jgi:hypothetical protein
MSNAKNNPVNRTYDRALHTGDIPDTQKAGIDLGLDSKIVHGESLVSVAGDVTHKAAYLASIAFMEEPITLLIEDNSNSDFPETHVPVSVNGKVAEVFQNGQWLPVGWFPIGQEFTTRRKYAEVLLRSKIDHVQTKHDDATIEKPRNTLVRRTKAAYPVTILVDENRAGREWAVRVRMSH